ncbi:hypothetical protein C5167_015756 [Papaver somniferum]|uniref:Uncharacterized protein n=1 Tax=Papaver somniferum TaxID=3469 RepID=A0A4Y7JA12_PAPSO|nr:hypothetical protein C5167_015756 [Papaver somniferum]
MELLEEEQLQLPLVEIHLKMVDLSFILKIKIPSDVNSLYNLILSFFRYGISLLKMDPFIKIHHRQNGSYFASLQWWEAVNGGGQSLFFLFRK